MKFSDIIGQIHAARAAHKSWVSRAEALVAGIPLEKEQVPLLPVDCIFGKWYYGQGQVLRSLPAFTQIEKPHEELHKIYMAIFKLLFDESDISNLARLFGQSKKIKAGRAEEAKAILPALRQLSDEMCELLATLENQFVQALKQMKTSKRNTNRQLDTITLELDSIL